MRDKRKLGEIATGFFTATVVVVGSFVFLCVFWWLVEWFK